MSNVHFYFKLCFLLALIATGCTEASHSAAPAASHSAAFNGKTMGTTYSVKFHAPGDWQAQEVHAKVDASLVEVNEQMSTYLPDSELSRFNASNSTKWFPVSSATAKVVSKAIEIHKLTDGALDVTVQPLVKLWKLNAYQSKPVEPSDEQIAATRKNTGVANISVQSEPPALRKENPKIEIDLSAIAKGYGVDCVAEVLEKCGIENYMVEIGGEVRAAGARADGRPWQIGVESPQQGIRELSLVIPLKNLAMATSGDYRNFHGSGGKAYTHIIDPRTGRPLLYRGVSVTVLAPTCMEADAYATALVVLGEETAYNWCEEHKVAAMFQTRTDEQESRQQATPEFEKLTTQQ